MTTHLILFIIAAILLLMGVPNILADGGDRSKIRGVVAVCIALIILLVIGFE